MKDKFANEDGFKIRVENLKAGHTETIQEKFSPDFMDVHEDRLKFNDPVLVAGEAYVADSDLILHLNVSTFATISCSICNEPVKVPLNLDSLYLNEGLSEIKTGVFSLVDPLREAILIETPAFAECNEGKCPERKNLEKYMKKPESSEETDSSGYRPFEDLKID